MSNNEAVKKQDNKTAIFQKLIESIMIEEVDSEGIEDLSGSVESMDDAAKLIIKIECVVKSKKNNILVLAYHQGIIFKKFKENSTFTSAVANLKISKTNINFKMGIIQSLHDYPNMRK